MKLTQILRVQHIGWHFKKHWRIQGKKIARETVATKILAQKGIPIYNPDDILSEKREFVKIDVVGYLPRAIPLDETHPNWHDRVCHTYRDDNVLLEGLTQAKILTKTVELQEGLPEKITLENVTQDIDRNVKKIVLNSHVFDSEQQKLPIRKDPKRPAWNFPRGYGITDKRINSSIIGKLLQVVECMRDTSITKQRSVLHDLPFSVPFERDGNLLQFILRGDTLLTSAKPLLPLSNASTENVDLPDIFPIHQNITLNKENIYEINTLYPINLDMKNPHPHTVFVHYNKTEVKNLFEEEVTEPQILGRSLMKAFTVAASYAKKKYGPDVKTLPTPVTIQCVQTDGRLFHFGVLQLNTLELDGGGVKNLWYHVAQIPLFSSCCYKSGQPILEGYSSEVIKHLIGFYNNV